VSFTAVTLCVASERVFVVYFVMTQSGNFWTHPRNSPPPSTKRNKNPFISFGDGTQEDRHYFPFMRSFYAIRASIRL
jgi:hypothetical protein